MMRSDFKEDHLRELLMGKGNDGNTARQWTERASPDGQ